MKKKPTFCDRTIPCSECKDKPCMERSRPWSYKEEQT